MSILQTNKKVAAGIGVAAAAAAAIALGGGTFAAFHASATGPGGTLAAGTMALSVSGPAATTDLFKIDNFYPGQPYTKIVYFTNVSGVDAYLSGSELLSGAVDGGTDGEHLRDQVTQSSHCYGGGEAAKDTNPALLRDVNGGAVDSTFVVKSNQTATCEFTFKFLDLGDNDTAQGDKLTVSSTFTLTQRT